MKKKGGGIFHIMRYLCLSSVIVFGLMTIVGIGDDVGGIAAKAPGK